MRGRWRGGRRWAGAWQMESFLSGGPLDTDQDRRRTKVSLLKRTLHFVGQLPACLSVAGNRLDIGAGNPPIITHFQAVWLWSVFDNGEEDPVADANDVFIVERRHRLHIGMPLR